MNATRKLPPRLIDYPLPNYVGPNTIAYTQHTRALLAPQRDELTTLLLADAIHRLAERTQGEDGYTDPIIRDLLDAFVRLLSAETGGLDGGTLDSWAREVADYIGEPLD